MLLIAECIGGSLVVERLAGFQTLYANLAVFVLSFLIITEIYVLVVRSGEKREESSFPYIES